MKKFIIALVIIILIGIGAYFFIQNSDNDSDIDRDNDITQEDDDMETSDRETDEEASEEEEGQTVIGESADGLDITAYHFGTGDTELLFVGGIHGGYSWNTALVAYELVDYLEGSPDTVPENLRVTVVPVLNPDGLNEVVGTSGRFEASDVPTAVETIPGRFNGNNVDLNRNFDCDWQASGTWQNREVGGGSQAFSEPESQAIRSYVEANNPEAVVVWYSSAGGVFASNCHGGVLEETGEIANVYAEASGYKAFEEFDFYEITGDMTNWLAKIGVPAISVLLTNHSDIEWNKNQAGIEALFEHYSN
jgi:hypothetical protein